MNIEISNYCVLINRTVREATSVLNRAGREHRMKEDWVF